MKGEYPEGLFMRFNSLSLPVHGVNLRNFLCKDQWTAGMRLLEVMLTRVGIHELSEFVLDFK